MKKYIENSSFQVQIVVINKLYFRWCTLYDINIPFGMVLAFLAKVLFDKVIFLSRSLPKPFLLSTH